MKDREFPNGFVRILFQCNRILGHIEAILSMIILWALIAVVVVFISCRFIFYVSTPWADELARYFLIALGWFGASYAASVGDHLEIDLIGSIVNKHSKNPEKILAVIDRFAQVLVLGFLLFFTYIYAQFVSKIGTMGKMATAIPISMTLPMSLVTIGCVLLILHTLCKILLPYEFWNDVEAEAKQTAEKGEES